MISQGCHLTISRNFLKSYLIIPQLDLTDKICSGTERLTRPKPGHVHLQLNEASLNKRLNV